MGQQASSLRYLACSDWARYVCNLSSELAPVPMPEFKAFFEGLWSEKEGERKIKSQRKTDFLNWLSHRSGRSMENLSHQYGLILENLFAEVEEEYAAVLPENLDARFIHLFLIEN